MHAQAEQFGRLGFEGWRFRTEGCREIPTPGIADGRIFFSSGFGSYQFTALNLRTGSMLWQIRTGDDGPSAAVVEGDVLAYSTESCTLEVVGAADGKSRWSRRLGDPLLAMPAIGAGRVVIAYPLGRGEHRLAAFELTSGEPIWDAALPHDCITAPVIVGNETFTSSFDGSVSCFDLGSGALKWRRAMQATSAPWISGDAVYVARRHAPAAQERNPRQSPGKSDPDEWITRLAKEGGVTSAHYRSSKAPYLKEDFGPQRKGMAARLDASAGFAHAPAAAKLEAVSDLIGEKTVSRAWRFQGSRPVAANGMFFETTGDVLTARSIEDAAVRWTWKNQTRAEGERQITPAAVANGRVLIGTWDGRLVSLDAATGAIRWEVKAGAPCHWQPVMRDGWVSAGLEDGSVIAFATGDTGDDGFGMWGGGAGHNGQEIGPTAISEAPSSAERPQGAQRLLQF